jgi:ribosomal protein L40E
MKEYDPFAKDKGIMSDREKRDWERSLDDLHDLDIDWLYLHLKYRIAHRKRQEEQNVRFKICDKCTSTYPYYTDRCSRCGNEMLREFQTNVTDVEILDG